MLLALVETCLQIVFDNVPELLQTCEFAFAVDETAQCAMLLLYLDLRWWHLDFFALLLLPLVYEDIACGLLDLNPCAE